MSKEIDYKELLTKYMSLVIEAEGITFIGSHHQEQTSITKEEETELFEIASSIDPECEDNVIKYTEMKDTTIYIDKM